MSLLSVKSQSSKSKRKKKRIRIQGVYVWGNGTYGQLGIGEEVDRKIPTFLDLFRDDKKSGEYNIKKENANKDQRKKKGRMICISCGGSHSAIVKALIDGKTSVCVEGRNNYGQLGLPDKDLDIVNIPSVITALNDVKVRQIACGGGHTIALSDEGDVYTWGWSIYGQLGLGKDRDETSDKKSVPTLVPYFRENSIKIKAISAGGGHSAFVDALGQLYVCGMNNTGQLGLGDTEPRYEPKLVTKLQDSRIERVVCGEAHTAVVDDHGLLYTWGCGELFRLGHLTEDNELSPKLVQHFVDEVLEIKDVACGLSHTLAVTASGLVYSWGSNKFGELGLGNLYSKKRPSLIEDLPGPVRVVRAGHGFSAAITDLGQLFMWGNGANGKLGHGSESNEKFPKKLSALSDICVLDVQLGASHVSAYADTGSNDRNRSILKIYSAEKNFLAHMGLVCNIISPVAASIVGEENWRITMGNFHNLHEYHRTKILLPVEQRLSKIHKELRLASIFKKAFEDPLFLKMQTEYSLNFAKGWQRFLECLKAISELGTFLKECFSSEEFARTGLVKIYRGAEQFNAFLELPLIYFNDIMPFFQDALDRTKKEREEYKDLTEVMRTLRQIADLSSSSISNTKFIKFLEFLKQFPEHQYLFEAHRRYINAFGFVTNENEERPSHSLVLFNDLIAIVNHRNEKKDLENLMFLQGVFLKDVRNTSKPCFMIGTQQASYTMFFDTIETKDSALALLNETIRIWVDNHPRAKESRLKSGIELVVTDLQQVMPLIHKDWIQEVEELQISGITTGEDLQKINRLFSRTAQTLEYENAKKQKMLTANLSNDIQAPEVFYTTFTMAAFSSKRKGSTAFNYKAYAKYKKQSVDFSSGEKKDLSARSSDYSTESIIQRNHSIRMKFAGNQTVSEVKYQFYSAIKDSPWVEFCDLGPLDQYELKIKGLDYRLTNESLTLNRIPVIQMIITSSFVTPFLELVPKVKTTNMKLEFESEMKLFDDLSAILGELKPFFNSTHVEEMTNFRRAVARQRTTVKHKSPLEAAVETSGGITQALASTLNISAPSLAPSSSGLKIVADAGDIVHISASLFDRLEIPEAWKGLEAAPLAWPATFTVNVLTTTGEKITLEVQPTASINKLRDDVFLCLYKKEKHKRKVHLPRFVKDLAQKAGNLTESREGSNTPIDQEVLNEVENNSNVNNTGSNTNTSASENNTDTSSVVDTSLSMSSDEEAMEEIESATVEASTVPVTENNGPAESDSEAEELDMKHQILTNEAIAERLSSITITPDEGEVVGAKESEKGDDKGHRHEHKKSRDKATEAKEKIDKKPRSSPKLGRKFPPMTASTDARSSIERREPSDSLRSSMKGEPVGQAQPVKERITGPQTAASRKKLKTKTHSTVLAEIETLISVGEGTEGDTEKEADDGPDSQRTIDDNVHSEHFRKKKKSSKDMLPGVAVLKKKGSAFKESKEKEHKDKEKREEKKQRKEKEREEKKQRKVKEREEKRQRKQEKLRRKKYREKSGQKKTHVKKLSNGLTVSDFILKVYGANEYLIGENPIGSYDYIRKCVKQGLPINLKLLSASSLTRSSAQETENYVTDKAIAEEILEEDIMLNNSSPVNMTTMTPTSTNYAPRPFFDLADFTVPFKIKVLDCENLFIDPDLSKKMTIFVALGIHQMGMKKSPMRITQRVMYANNPIWNEEISFDIPTNTLTRESRLLVGLYGRTDSSNTSNEVLLSDIPLAWLNINLFTQNSCSRAGLTGLKMWEQRFVIQAHPDVATGENLVSTTAPLLFVELFAVSSEDEREGMFTFRKRKRSKAKLKVKTITKSESTKEPSMEEITYLKQIIARDSLEKFKNDAERDLIFHHRRWCKEHPDSLPWLLRSIDWCNREAVTQIHKALETWPLIDPFKAIELADLTSTQLLDNRYMDLTVRSYAVKCLQKLSDVDLYKILLQLVQALKFEPHHASDLAAFLLERALKDKNRIGFRLFWLLKSELHVPYLIERFGLILEAYLRSCGVEYRQELLNQHTVFIEQLYHIATEIRKETRHKQRKMKLQQLLKAYEWPARFLLPLDPRVECSGFIMEKCRVLGSKTVPLFLAFKNAETGEAVNVIFKVGDDLRQDVLTLQIIGLMDSMWKHDGLDLRLKPYGCLALGNEFGLIEVVPHAHTTSNINIELGGVRAVYSRETLSKWLRTQNPTEAAWRRAVETFMASCAGYTVLTFALGLADRHNDNIMLTKDGNLFHIDFGHFLGHYRKIMGSFYADKADLVFIDQYYHIIGKEHYGRFKDICCRAYNIVRAHANIFIDLLSLMLASGLPELTSKKDVAFVKERLRLDLTPEEAAEYFKHKLEENRDAKTILFNHAFHVMYHGMRNN